MQFLLDLLHFFIMCHKNRINDGSKTIIGQLLFPIRFNLYCFRRKSSTWLLSAHYRRIFFSKTSRQDFLPTGPNRSSFLGFCKGFRRVIGYMVGWRAFLRYSPLKTQFSFSFSVHRAIVKNPMDLCAKNTAHFIYKVLIHKQVRRDPMF